MKNRWNALISVIGFSCFVLMLVFMFANCGSSSDIYTLSNPPSDTAFKATNGVYLQNAAQGITVQLRDREDNILLQFSLSGDVNFSNVTAERDSTKTVVHFGSDDSRNGLGDTLTMFVPCAADTGEVHICPQASSVDRVVSGCDEEVTLTASDATGGGYTWDNVVTRTGTDDCQISAATDEFGTGAYGAE